ncbi:MAG: trypsin-like peptidase domain-containing protein [Clostridia bacterium]|nr:trypsin-like peptidase domain-containing protein [Clostridia bacterium]
MKKTVLKLGAAMLVIVMMLSLSSCVLIDEIMGNNQGVWYPPQTDTDLKDNININNVTINPQGGNLAFGANEGVRSIVSVYCTFGGGLLGGGSGSTGSGIIYKVNSEGDAFIITNYHVVHNSSLGISEKIDLYLYGMEYVDYTIPATYVGGSMNYDIAILRVDDSEVLKKAYANGSVQAVKIADSDKISIGQATIAIGNPQGQGISVTTGVISVDSEYIDMTGSDGKTAVSFRVMRTDTPVNSGNSGGGFFNSKGELIGVVNAKIINSDVENIGYAIPSNVARAIADNIIDYCYGKECKTVMRGILGITVVANSLSTYYDETEGVVVRVEEIAVHDVTAGGLGSKMFQTGDIIKSVTIGDKEIEITRQHHLIDAMLDVRVGDTVTNVIVRNGEEMVVSTVITQDCLAAY